MSHWRHRWRAIPDCPAQHDDDDTHIHTCVNRVDHRPAGHVCACGLLWNEEP